MTACNVPNCDRKYAAKGYCHFHYNRWKRRGDPLVAHRIVPRDATIEERLEILTDRSGGPDACWPFTGALNGKYGRIRVNGVTKGIHVWALIAATGDDLSDRFDALHSCDNPPCTNPAHLRWGTLQDNMDDKVARGRQSRMVGQEHPGAKLTWASVREMRARSTDPRRVLAAEFGVSRTLVSLILRNERWIEAAA